jgi:putative transposase
MSDLFWLDEEHLKRIGRMFPKPRGVKRADDRRVLSSIIHVIRNGLRWREAPSEYGPHKTWYNRFLRWSRIGVFARIFKDLARPPSKGGSPAGHRLHQWRLEQQVDTICDERRPLNFFLSAGQMSDAEGAPAVLRTLALGQNAIRRQGI